MKERPILFSGPMVRALLDGSKTQTRRIVKPAGAHHIFQFRGTEDARGADEPTGEWAWCRAEHVVSDHIRCPFGKPGDRLWVRETHEVNRIGFEEHGNGDTDYYAGVAYQADDGRTQFSISGAMYRKLDATESRGWAPSIHMPRWASRITLEVTGVRVERLQDVTEADAAAEGVESLRNEGEYWKDYLRSTAQCDELVCLNARDSFGTLWDSLNAARGFGWDANPWVWVVEFKRIEA
ncbi:ASCH domain-containing protein [Paraburkholderia hospita]|uniref:ASCH domain-containing protein n=1 Tax=Paraburkholderia hospita TaxID=169430 RepID=UPI000B3477F2|nr:ASCH domain-containing protein [Paraburkholderia hospita]OUL79902.1 hypothetical protein CA603_33020 [Paraburkholderia hospita]